jgi:SAM-dependent methyltransferase
MVVAVRSLAPPRVPLDFASARARYDELENKKLFEEPGLRNLASGALVVSVGEGTGEYLLALSKRFPRLWFVGFDFDPHSIAIAQRLRTLLRAPNAWFGLADALALPLPDRAADYVYSRCVLQVIPDKDAFLREIKRVSRGVVHISMIRNNLVAGPYVRLTAPIRMMIRGGRLKDWTDPARLTESWLKKIDAYRGIGWYATVIRRHFPNARFTCSRMRPSVGFEMSVGSPDLQRRPETASRSFVRHPP